MSFKFVNKPWFVITALIIILVTEIFVFSKPLRAEETTSEPVTIFGDKGEIAKQIQGFLDYPDTAFYFGDWILSTIDKWSESTARSPIHGSVPQNTTFVLFKSPVQVASGQNTEIKCIEWTVFKTKYSKPNFSGDAEITVLTAETCQLYNPSGAKVWEYTLTVLGYDRVVDKEGEGS